MPWDVGIRQTGLGVLRGECQDGYQNQRRLRKTILLGMDSHVIIYKILTQLVGFVENRGLLQRLSIGTDAPASERY